MPTDPVLSKMAELHDKLLLEILERGTQRVLIRDKEGNTNVEEIDLTPAMFRAIEARLHHMGASASRALDDARVKGRFGQYFENLRTAGRIGPANQPLPSLSTEPDAATG